MSQSVRNLITPFRRDRKRDFASDDGAELLKSKVLQALMTRGTTPRSSGEMPWRTAFGSGLDLLRHQRNDDVLSELATVYVRETLKKWVPEVTLLGVSVTRQDATLQIRARYCSAASISASQETVVELSIPVDA
jgi:phage baseplate assembly protein W